MAWYRARYKCRLCGEIYGETLSPDQWEAFTDVSELAATGRNDHRIGAPAPQSIHICKNKSFGLADFIGMEVVEKYEEG